MCHNNLNLLAYRIMKSMKSYKKIWSGKGGTHASLWTYRGRDENEQGVAINTHSLQKGVTSHLALISFLPGQEPPSTQWHQPGVHENDYCCYGDWKQDIILNYCIKYYKKKQHVKVTKHSKLVWPCHQKNVLSIMSHSNPLPNLIFYTKKRNC